MWGVKDGESPNTVCLQFIRYVGIGPLGVGTMEFKAPGCYNSFLPFQLFAVIKLEEPEARSGI